MIYNLHLLISGSRHGINHALQWDKHHGDTHNTRQNDTPVHALCISRHLRALPIAHPPTLRRAGTDASSSAPELAESAAAYDPRRPMCVPPLTMAQQSRAREHRACLSECGPRAREARGRGMPAVASGPPPAPVTTRGAHEVHTRCTRDAHDSLAVSLLLRGVRAASLRSTRISKPASKPAPPPPPRREEGRGHIDLSRLG